MKNPFTRNVVLPLRHVFYRWLYRNRRNIAVSHDDAFWKLFAEITRDDRLTLNVTEAYNLYRIGKRVIRLDGDVAEVGVFRGGSARVLAEIKGDKHLHLFDTFGGLPTVDGDMDKTDRQTAFTTAGRGDTELWQGKYSGRHDEVVAYLSPFPHIHIYPGIFPQTAGSIADRRFCLVHLDVDIHEGTRAGLEFFYPRLVKGGVLISHDYGTVSCPGVKRAFDDFMKDKNETLLELWDTQVMIVKE